MKFKVDLRKHVFSCLTYFFVLGQAEAKLCLYVSSYHKGYEWNDQIESGLDSQLKGSCRLEKFYLDAKNQKNEKSLNDRSDAARDWIKERNPDVVIISDDDAVGRVLARHFKRSSISFVYCGVKWSAAEFGLPFKNTTGIIAVSMIKPMLQELLLSEFLKFRKLGYLAYDSDTARKSYRYSQKIFESLGIDSEASFPKDFDSWKATFLKYQQRFDAVYLLGFSGIRNWDKKSAVDFVEKNIKKQVLSTSIGMLPYSTFSAVWHPKELGDWAGQRAVQILNGTLPSAIPEAKNEEYDSFYNKTLLEKVPSKLSADFLRKAKHFQQ